jgi:DNA-binding response OmpR family regulator
VRILVVEDDALIREFVVEALREEGFNVIHASNGEEALAWCKRRVADVLVTDIKLPGKVDGWQIAECFREHDPTLPVIYATAFSPVEARPVSGSLSLRKPYQPEDVIKAVKEFVRTKSALLELRLRRQTIPKSPRRSPALHDLARPSVVGWAGKGWNQSAVRNCNHEVVLKREVSTEPWRLRSRLCWPDLGFLCATAVLASEMEIILQSAP